MKVGVGEKGHREMTWGWTSQIQSAWKCFIDKYPGSKQVYVLYVTVRMSPEGTSQGQPPHLPSPAPVGRTEPHILKILKAILKERRTLHTLSPRRRCFESKYKIIWCMNSPPAPSQAMGAVQTQHHGQADDTQCSASSCSSPQQRPLSICWDVWGEVEDVFSFGKDL